MGTFRIAPLPYIEAVPVATHDIGWIESAPPLSANQLNAQAADSPRTRDHRLPQPGGKTLLRRAAARLDDWLADQQSQGWPHWTVDL